MEMLVKHQLTGDAYLMSLTACRDIIEPFTIVSIEDDAGELLQLFVVQFIDVHYGSFAFAQETLPIFFSLFAQ